MDQLPMQNKQGAAYQRGHSPSQGGRAKQNNEGDHDQQAKINQGSHEHQNLVTSPKNQGGGRQDGSQFKNQVLKNLQLQGGSGSKLDSAHIDANPLVSPSAGGSSAYISSKERGTNPQGSVSLGPNSQTRINKQYPGGGAAGPVEMAELTTPRNAIGNFSGVIMPTNQGAGGAQGQQKYSNVMTRRKSNALHGPVDIASMMRANRGPITGGSGEGNASQGGSSIHRNQAEPNVSSRGLRGNVMTSAKQQYAPQQQEEGGIHLPPMPLTPTEQQRQKERERNSSNQKTQNGTGGVSQYAKGREIYDLQANYQVGKRPRDNSAGVQDVNSLNQQSRNYQNGGMPQNNPPGSGNNQNQQKMKMLYKKQMNSHRATSQTTAINGAAARDAQNLQTHRNAPHNSQFNSHARSIHNQKQISQAFFQNQRDHSNAPQTEAPSYLSNSTAASVIQNHSYGSNRPPSQVKNNEPLDIEKLLLGNGPPPDPGSLNLPSWEPTKCSVRENGFIMGYAANTNQGIIRDYNEDRVSIVLNIMQPPTKKDVENWPKCSFFGVFDGHGGNTCADFLRDNLHQFIIKDAQFPQNPRQAIINGYKKAENYFLDTVEAFAQGRHHMLDKSGSCAIVALLVEKRVYIVNVGDSRAIMSYDGGNYCCNLSLDHKPNDEQEQKRILSNGGRVYQTQTIARGDTQKSIQTITYQPGQDNSAVLAGNEKGREENPNIIYGPYRVFPGRLSVSRTFGDIEAKREKFGGNPNVVVASPDIKEFNIDDNMDFLLLGCDGIFDKISNAEVLKQGWIAAKKNFHSKDQPIHQTCGYVVEQVMKASVAYKTLDNITVVLLAFKNFKQALSNEFMQVNGMMSSPNDNLQSKESGAVSNSQVGEEQSQGRGQPATQTACNGGNTFIENLDSANGGLAFTENAEVLHVTKEEISQKLSLPNADVTFDDIEIMKSKPRMPPQKKLKISRHGNIHKVTQQLEQQANQEKKPLSPVIRRSAINNLVGSPNHQSHPQNSSFTTNSQKQSLGLNSIDSPLLNVNGATGNSTLRSQQQNNADFQHQGSSQLPGAQYHSQTTKNSQSKKFNMRVGNMTSSNETIMSSKTDSTLQSGPQGGIVGAGISPRNSNGISANPLSHREKPVGRSKDQIMQKYQRNTESSNLTNVNKSDMNYQQNAWQGGQPTPTGQQPRSTGFRTNRNATMNDNRLLPRGDSSQRPNLQDFGTSGQMNNQNWINPQNLNSQRNNNMGNLSRGKNFLVQNSAAQPMDSQMLANQQKQKPIKNQNNSMLYPNSGNSTKLSSGGQPQAELVSRRQKMTGSGGLNQSVGASSNLNPLSSQTVGAASGQSQHPASMNHMQQDLNQSQQMAAQDAVFTTKMGNIMYQRKHSRASKSRGNSNKTPNIQDLSAIPKNNSQALQNVSQGQPQSNQIQKHRYSQGRQQRNAEHSSQPGDNNQI